MKEDLSMNGVLVSSSDLLPEPSIVPSSGNVISRAVVAGDKARYVVPLYNGIAVGDLVTVLVDTDGSWSYFSQATVNDVDTMLEFRLFDPLFAPPATTATARYIVNNQNYSAPAVYAVED
jgi:hypothetical protein